MRRRTAAVIALVLSAALGGCGSGGRVSPPAGPRLFAADCSSCHTLDGHDDPRRQGGDLLHLRIDSAALRQFTAEMPTPRRLTAGQVGTIDVYLLALEKR